MTSPTETAASAGKAKCPEIGTVIHGTMRSEDLLPCVATVLAFYSDEPEDIKLAEEATAMVGRLQRGEIEPGVPNDDMDLLVEVGDRLDEIALERSGGRLRFGAHAGDGSDYGFWEIDEDG